jgi:Lrp/AsnC family leucine-responsive transcriptional regulator
MQETVIAKLDEIDRAILATLERNARATNEAVGNAVGLSASAVSRRIRSLQDRGILTGFHAVIDERLVGKQMVVFTRVTLDRQSAAVLKAFESSIRRCKSVSSCHLMSGQYDYLLQIKATDINDYERIHQKELSPLPGVARIESSFAVRDVLAPVLK